MSPCRTVRRVFSKKTREVGFGRIGSLRDSTTCRPVSALSTVLGWGGKRMRLVLKGLGGLGFPEGPVVSRS